MSHFSFTEIEIENVDKVILRQAIEEIARERNATATTLIRDYYGNTIEVLAGFTDNVFHRGVGVIIDNGKVKLVGDFWGVEYRKVKSLYEEIIQRYTAKAIESTLIEMGYSVSSEKHEDKIVLIAETW